MNVLNFYETDTNPNKPKLIKKGGKFTKTFLRYNRKLLKEGKVDNYVEEGFYFNIFTGRRRKIVYDKRYKDKVIKKSFLKSFPIKNNVFSLGTDSVKGTMSGGPEDFRNIINENNLFGRVRIIFYREGKIIWDAEENINNFNSWWKKNWPRYIRGESAEQKFLWMEDLEQELPFADYLFTKQTKIKRNTIKQIFRDGQDYYCFYTVILNYFKEKLEATKGKRNKEIIQGKLNYLQGKELKHGYKYGILQKYKGGMPEDKQLLSQISNRLNVGFDIEQPFLDDVFIRVRPLKPVKKVFKYINSRLNHLESVEQNSIFNNLSLNDSKKIEYVERHELYSIMNELQKNDTCFIYGKDSWGVKNVKTATNYYSVKCDYKNTVEEFEKEIGMNQNLSLEYYEDKNLTEFIRESNHYNGTTDFIDTEGLNVVGNDNIKHIDMEKAYSQFYNSKYYDGFMGIVTTSIRPINCYKGYKGCFYITDLEFPHGKLKRLNDKLNIYFDGGIYYDPELKFLEENGVKFTVKYGVIGENFDFRFSKKMLEGKVEEKDGNKEFKVPFYSKWCGSLAMLNFNKKFYMRGKKDYFENLNTKADIWTADNKEFSISYDKKSVKHKSHITGQVTMYQRLNMLEQLFEMDDTKVIRVVTDGIYYYDHEFGKPEKVVFSYNKKKKPFESWGVWSTFCSQYNGSWKCENQERKYNRVEYHLGGGGAGKTHYNLTDKGIYNACYIAPSWYLSTEKKKEYNLKSSNVVARLTDKKLPYWKELMGKYNNLILDEISMYTQEQKDFIIKNFKGGIYFCGDLGFQLPPPCGLKEMDTKGGVVIEHEKLYRFKCPKLLKLVKYIRSVREEEMKGKKISSFDFIIKQFQNISFQELEKIYDVKDLIITSENKFIHEINNKITKEKYIVKNNTQLYKNGQILYHDPKISGVDIEKTNAFTIHKAQGKTTESKLFIDIRNIKSCRMIYTAITRARYWNQIYFF